MRMIAMDNVDSPMEPMEDESMTSDVDQNVTLANRYGRDQRDVGRSTSVLLFADHWAHLHQGQANIQIYNDARGSRPIDQESGSDLMLAERLFFSTGRIRTDLWSVLVDVQLPSCVTFTKLRYQHLELIGV